MALIRDIEALCPVVKRKCLQLRTEAARMGIKIMFNETRRTLQVQRAYYAQGRETLEVTNRFREKAGLWLITEDENSRIITKAIESLHMYDVAADFCLLIDGRPSWDDKADINDNEYSDYEDVGMIAEALGMDWGGRFTFRDLAHVQYTGGLTRVQLRAGMRPTEESYY
jgi:hypothetical protein